MGTCFRVDRKRGPQWYAKYRVPDGRQVQRCVGPAWTDRVEDLLEREVVADFMSVLCGNEQRPAGGNQPSAGAVEHGGAAVSVLEQIGGDVALAGPKAKTGVARP